MAKKKEEVMHDDPLATIMLCLGSIVDAAEKLEDVAKHNPKYRGKLVSLINRVRPLTRTGGMIESLSKALTRG